MADADRCILCGEVVPEGRQVCYTCELKAIRTGSPPTGYITSGDVSQMSGLKGQQVMALMNEWGVGIGGRTYIKFSVFDELRRAGRLIKYLAYPLYGVRIRKQWRHRK